MTENERKDLLEKIDLSDIRILMLGIVLLCVPMVFILHQSKRPREGFAAKEIKEKLSGGRGGFSFIQKSGGGDKQVVTAAIHAAARADKQWNDVIERVMSAPAPKFEGYPPTTKEFLEAQFDPRIKRANLLFEEGNPKEGAKILAEILKEDMDNPFLHLVASQRLCRYYQSAGMKAEEEKEFLRLLEILRQIPEMKNLAQYLSGCMEFVRQSPDLLGKYADNPDVKKYLQDYVTKSGSPLKTNELMTQTSHILSNLDILSTPPKR